jgi:ABC-type multidrug transport system fused ATPase/permease subunit
VLLPKVSPPKVFTFIDSWKVNWRIIALLRPHWLSTLGAVACLGLSTGFALIVPGLLAWVIDTGLQHGQFSTLLLATGAILATSTLRGLFAYGQGYLSQALSNLIAYDLRNRLYDHLQTLSFSFHLIRARKPRAFRPGRNSPPPIGGIRTGDKRLFVQHFPLS